MNHIDAMDDYSFDGEEYIDFDTEAGKKVVENIFTSLYKEYRNRQKIDDVEKADIIVGIGRGCRHSFDDVKIVSDRLNATLAGTRPLQDIGLLKKEYVLGKSARSAWPKVYITFGISGSIQHIGTVYADDIIAVNHNKNSAIFRHAKYRIFGDANKIARFVRDTLNNLQ